VTENTFCVASPAKKKPFGIDPALRIKKKSAEGRTYEKSEGHFVEFSPKITFKHRRNDKGNYRSREAICNGFSIFN
jgi:hypothetical protein